MVDKCHFCDEPAHGTCFWMVKQFVEVPVGDLVPGDIVRRFNDEITPVILAEIEEVTRSVGRIWPRMRRADKHGNPGNQFYGAMGFWPSQKFKVRRTLPCGLPVCEAHLIARAPGKYLCLSHAFAWQEVA